MSMNKTLKETFPPCVGCGYCCISGPCPRAVMFGWHINSSGICEKLFWSEGRYWCQEIIDNREVMEYLGIGAGCPSILGNLWRNDVRMRF